MALIWAAPSLALAAALTLNLSLEVSTRQLVAGRDETAALIVKGPPEALRDTKVACTNANLRGGKRTAPGELRFELMPPRSGEASWVLCAAASATTHAFGTTTLELQRREVLALANLPPLSRVEVKIGQTVFGPVRANGAGFAEVSVLLTPSVQKAEVIATPPGGAPQSRPQSLSVAHSSQTLLIPAAGDAKADGTTPLTVFAFTVNDRGELSNEPLTLTSDEGQFQDRALATGVHEAAFVPSGRAVDGEATLSGRIGEGKAFTTRVALTAGVTPKLELRSSVLGLAADGLAGADLAITVTDEGGRGLLNQKLTVSADRGVVGPVEERGAGLYGARYTSPTLGGPGEATLAATVEGSEPAKLTLKLTPPPRLTVDTAPREVRADGQSKVVLSIAARGPDGQPLRDGALLKLASSLGTVPASVATSGGRATAELVAGTRAGLATIDIRTDDASATAQVRLLPGPAAKVELRPDRGALVCDGKDSVQVHLLVQDANGNGLESLPIEISEAIDQPGGDPQASDTPRGHFDRVASLGGGEFTVRYYGPPSCARGEVELTATAGGIKGGAQLGLVRGFANAVGVTARVGGVHNLGRIVSGQLELEGDLPIAAISPRLLATAAAGVSFSAPYGGTASSLWAGYVPFTASTLVASLLVGPRYTLFEDARLHLYAGAGVDAHFVRASYAFSFGGELPTVQRGFAFGAHLRIGGGYALGNGLAVGQLRYGVAPWVPGQSAVRGQVSGLSFELGYRLSL